MENLQTYGQLKQTRFSKELSQHDRNALSTLNSFMSSLSLSDECIIGQELTTEFEIRKKNFTSTFKTPSTRYSKGHLLKGWYKYFHSQVNNPVIETSGHTFHSFVLQKAVEKGMDAWSISRAVGSRTPYNWLKYGQTPSSRSLHLVDVISVTLGYESTYLRDIFFNIPVQNKVKYNLPPTSYQKKLKENRGSYKQITKQQWNGSELEKLQKELVPFIEFKTMDVLDDGVDRPAAEVWKVEMNGYSGTIGIFNNLMQAYYGFLANVEGVPLEELSLTHLMDSELVTKYMKFQNRLQGRATTTIINFLINIKPVIKYLIQYPDNIYPDLSREDTVMKLEKYFSIISKKKLSIKITKASRDPEEQIRPILDLPDPLEPFFEMLSYMKKHYFYLEKQTVKQTTWLHELARNIVLMNLIIEKPIRAKNLAELKVGEHITKLHDGRYQLYIPKEQVKNNKQIKKKLSKELSTWIDVYLDYHRNELCGEEAEHFIVSREAPVLSSASVSKTCGRICQKYIGINMRTHAIRHIRATAYLLKHPKDYIYAAELLNDDPTTVTKKYCHLEGRAHSEQDDKDLEELTEKYSF